MLIRLNPCPPNKKTKLTLIKFFDWNWVKPFVTTKSNSAKLYHTYFSRTKLDGSIEKIVEENQIKPS